MIRLIESNSPLKQIPKEIGRKDILIFDSLRFTCEMIEHAYNQLIAEILTVSRGTSKKHLPTIFGYSWSIIGHSVRLANICRQLPWEHENEIVGHLHYLKDYRNTYQHLDERIQESLIANELPFYGVISWIYKLPNSLDYELHQLISGIWFSGSAGEQTIPTITPESPEIIDLVLHTINRKGQVIFTDLEKVIFDVKRLITEIEIRFYNLCKENNFQLCDWSRRQDVMLTIKNGTTT